SGGGRSYWAPPSSKGSFTIPSMASRGIHDTEVTEDSILTRAAPPACGRRGMAHPMMHAPPRRRVGLRAPAPSGSSPRRSTPTATPTCCASSTSTPRPWSGPSAASPPKGGSRGLGPSEDAAELVAGHDRHELGVGFQAGGAGGAPGGGGGVVEEEDAAAGGALQLGHGVALDPAAGGDAEADHGQDLG